MCALIDGYAEAIDDLIPGIVAWLAGAPLCDIERALDGAPDSNAVTHQVCPRARELVSSIIPRGLSFIMGLVTRIVEEVNPYDAQENLTANLVGALSAAVRLGYDSPEKLSFAFANPSILSRVGVHQKYSQL